MKRLLLVLLLLPATLMLVAPGRAAAHAQPVSTTPANGAQIALTDAPTQVAINFSEPVAKDATTIQVLGPDGTSVTTGAAAVNFDDPKLVTVPLGPLGGGQYTVRWHAVTSDDNGQTDGTFQFMIVVNTGGGLAGGTAGGGTTTTSTPAGGTLPPTGRPLAAWLPALLAGTALIVAGAGVLTRRRAAR